MLSSDCRVLVGGSSSRLSQYRQARGPNPAWVESSDCVSPASVRAARNCLPEAMFDIISLFEVIQAVPEWTQPGLVESPIDGD